MKLSSIPEFQPPKNDVSFLPEPKDELVNPIQNIADGVSEVTDGFLQSTGFVHNRSGWRLDDRGVAEFRKLVLGTKTIAVSAGQSIQAAIDDLAVDGGGIINLGAGTHIPSGSIIFPTKTPIRVLGENMSTTVIAFTGTANKMVIAGSGIYTTGTVSITSGTTVTGSSTNWLSSGLVAGDEIFLDNRWYKIGAITTNTSMVLAEPFAGTPLSGATYRAGSIARDIELSELTIAGGTGIGLDIDDARNIITEDTVITGSGSNGVTMNNVSETQSGRLFCIANTGSGCIITNGTLNVHRDYIFYGNGANGLSLDTVGYSSFDTGSFQANTSNGFSITSCYNTALSNFVSAQNGGKGGEFVSGNTIVPAINGAFTANTSDGVKLTATSDGSPILACSFSYNGGYGINIAASTCDNNIISSSTFISNSSGAVSDSGTGTVIRGNVGVSDNTLYSASTVYGNGGDGALAITSGTTTIDLAGAAVVEKQYTSISITGTGKLAFSNPHANGTKIILRSQGNVTLTSSSTPMLDFSGLGAAGGAGSTNAGTCGTANGTNGAAGTTASDVLGSEAARGGASNSGSPGAAYAALLTLYATSASSLTSSAMYFTCGSGGGGGQAGQGSGSGGDGGRGGGAAIVFCGGAWNFTTTSGISVAGQNGSPGQASGCSAGYNGGGGGGGGSGGWFIALYRSLTANSGTVTTSGGAGGAGATGTGCGTQGGNGGLGAGMYGGAGGSDSATANCGGYTGGSGYAGVSLITQNLYF